MKPRENFNLKEGNVMAELISFVMNLVDVAILLTKSISIHGDYQGVYFGKSLLYCQYWDAKLVTNLQKPIRMSLILSGNTFRK